VLAAKGDAVSANVELPCSHAAFDLASMTTFSRGDLIGACPGCRRGKKASEARLLADIREMARSSIGSPVPLASPAIAMLRLITAEGRRLIRQRDAIKPQAHALLSDNPDYNRLRPIAPGPGIVPSVPWRCLPSSGPCATFCQHRQFLKFRSPNFVTHQFGQFRGRTMRSILLTSVLF
jgi:hypothetical protein